MSDGKDGQDVQRLTDALEKFNKRLEKIGGTNNNNFNINLGGFGLGVALSLVAIMVVVALFQSVDIAKMERKLDRQEDYVNQIYRNLESIKKGNGK